MNSPAPPSTACTRFAACGRNGEMSVLISETAWASVCSTVESRSRWSSPLSLNGSVFETYALASPTMRITSASAAF